MLYNEIIFSSGWVDPCGWAGPVNLGPTMLYFEFLNIKCFNRTYGNHREISNKRNLKYVSVSIRSIYSNQNIIHTKKWTKIVLCCPISLCIHTLDVYVTLFCVYRSSFPSVVPHPANKQAVKLSHMWSEKKTSRGDRISDW